MEEKNKQNSWSVLGFAWELGYSIAIPLVIFTLGGKFLDNKLGTSPWLLLISMLLSIGITFYMVYSKLTKIIKDEENKKQ